MKHENFNYREMKHGTSHKRFEEGLHDFEDDRKNGDDQGQATGGGEIECTQEESESVVNQLISETSMYYFAMLFVNGRNSEIIAKHFRESGDGNQLLHIVEMLLSEGGSQTTDIDQYLEKRKRFISMTRNILLEIIQAQNEEPQKVSLALQALSVIGIFPDLEHTMDIDTLENGLIWEAEKNFVFSDLRGHQLLHMIRQQPNRPFAQLLVKKLTTVRNTKEYVQAESVLLNILLTHEDIEIRRSVLMRTLAPILLQGALKSSTIHKLLNACELPAEAITDAWEQNRPLKKVRGSKAELEQNKVDIERSRVCNMLDLERVISLEHFMPGAARALHEQYNLTLFGRYTTDMLMQQMKDAQDSEAWSRKYGISTSVQADYNGALYNETYSGTSGLSSFSRSLHEIPDKNGQSEYAFFAFETGSPFGFMRQFSLLKKEISEGKRQKASFFILNTHGLYNRITTGHYGKARHTTVSIDAIERSGILDEIDSVLEKDAVIVFQACQVGVKDVEGEAGFARKLARALQKKFNPHIVIGPEESITECNIIPTQVQTLSGENKLKLDVIYGQYKRHVSANSYRGDVSEM